MQLSNNGTTSFLLNTGTDALYFLGIDRFIFLEMDVDVLYSLAQTAYFIPIDRVLHSKRPFIFVMSRDGQGMTVFFIPRGHFCDV